MQSGSWWDIIEEGLFNYFEDLMQEAVGVFFLGRPSTMRLKQRAWEPHDPINTDNEFKENIFKWLNIVKIWLLQCSQSDFPIPGWLTVYCYIWVPSEPRCNSKVRRRELTPESLGAEGVYLAGNLRVFWEILDRLPTFYLVGKLRVDSKFAHHFDLNLITG